MSDLVVFSVGVFIFAITVFGTIIGSGISLSRRQVRENSHLRERVDSEELDKRFPIKVKY